MNGSETTRRSDWCVHGALWISLVALCLSAASLTLALRAEDRAYARLVSEVEDCLRPLYRDFNLKFPASNPESIGQLIVPLFEAASISSSLAPSA